MKITVPVVIEMTDQQVADYGAEYSLSKPGFKLYGRDVVEHVQQWIVADLQRGPLADFAEITLKGR